MFLLTFALTATKKKPKMKESIREAYKGGIASLPSPISISDCTFKDTRHGVLTPGKLYMQRAVSWRMTLVFKSHSFLMTISISLVQTSLMSIMIMNMIRTLRYWLPNFKTLLVVIARIAFWINNTEWVQEILHCIKKSIVTLVLVQFMASVITGALTNQHYVWEGIQIFLMWIQNNSGMHQVI